MKRTNALLGSTVRVVAECGTSIFQSRIHQPQLDRLTQPQISTFYPATKQRTRRGKEKKKRRQLFFPINRQSHLTWAAKGTKTLPGQKIS